MPIKAKQKIAWQIEVACEGNSFVEDNYLISATVTTLRGGPTIPDGTQCLFYLDAGFVGTGNTSAGIAGYNGTTSGGEHSCSAVCAGGSTGWYWDDTGYDASFTVL